jgi:hypothetical protein
MPSLALPLEADRSKFPPGARHLAFHSIHLPLGTAPLRTWQANVRLVANFARLGKWFAYRGRFDTWTRFLITNNTPRHPQRSTRARAAELVAAVERAPLAWIPAMDDFRRILVRDLVKAHGTITRSIEKTGMSASPIRREEIIEILHILSLT